MIGTMFSSKITLFKRISGTQWKAEQITDVYLGTEKKEVISGNQRTYVYANVLIIPKNTDISVGDIVYPSIPYPGTPDASGNGIIKNGGWRVKSVRPNVYPGCTVNHIYARDV